MTGRVFRTDPFSGRLSRLPRIRRVRLMVPVAIVLAVGMTLIGLVYSIVLREENNRVAAALAMTGDTLSESFNRETLVNLQVTRSMGAFYAGSEFVSRLNFRDYCRSVLQSRDTIRCLGWALVVKESERTHFENAAHKDRLPFYHIADRPAYIPGPGEGKDRQCCVLYYAEPLEINELPYGLNLYSCPEYRNILRKACDDGSLVVSKHIALSNDYGNPVAFVAFQPIYHNRRPLDTMEQRRANLQGYAVGVFRLSDILSDAEKAQTNHLLFMRVRDKETGALLYEEKPESDETVNKSGTSYLTSVNVGGREGTIRFSPTKLFISEQSTRQPTYVLVIGSIFLIVICTFVQLQVNHAIRMERLASDLDAARKEALESSRLKSQFVANISHELRTPMNGILGMNGFMLETKLTEEQRDYAGTVQECATSLLHVINDVLAEKITAAQNRCRNLATGKYSIHSPAPDKPLLRVLLAEDNDVNLMVANRMLSNLGCEVTTARNGRKAVEEISKAEFDLALLDIQMPEMDGYEATAAIRQLEDRMRSRVPIIAMTAHAFNEDRQRCFLAGMDDFTSKPVSLKDLREKLDDWRDRIFNTVAA